jgi:hypothetical protein
LNLHFRARSSNNLNGKRSLFSASTLRRTVRPFAFCLLCLYIFGTFGFLLPPRKNNLPTERYPCEFSPCGCLSASHCWEKCCCFTDEEKVEWAEKNDVSIPEHVRDRLREKASIRVDNTQTRVAMKCVNPGERGCGNTSASNASNDSMRSSADPTESMFAQFVSSLLGSEKVEAPEDRETSESTSSHSRVVLLDSSLKCHGLESLLVMLSSSLLPNSNPATTQSTIVVTTWHKPCDELFKSACIDVAGPVPRAYA